MSWRDHDLDRVRCQLACTRAMAGQLAVILARHALGEDTPTADACAEAALELLEAINQHDRIEGAGTDRLLML